MAWRPVLVGIWSCCTVFQSITCDLQRTNGTIVSSNMRRFHVLALSSRLLFQICFDIRPYTHN